jgi:hypothetical protein
MSKTQKQIDEFFKVKQEQEQTLQPRSQMILNDEPLPSSIKNKDLLKKNYKFKTTHELWDTITELESLLDNYRRFPKLVEDIEKLKSEVHSDIEKVWMYDGSFPLNQISMEERAKLIERVFYKVANQWID